MEQRNAHLVQIPLGLEIIEQESKGNVLTYERVLLKHQRSKSRCFQPQNYASRISSTARNVRITVNRCQYISSPPQTRLFALHVNQSFK